ncbi:TLD-domain-containing protein [Cunninghamella echinulata]|nr:TLD-domain-containing protein [Cunninghamella echinulata]
MKKQQQHHHRGASTSSINNREVHIPLHRSITDNHEDKHQQEKHKSPIARFVCKLLGIDRHRHHQQHNNNNNNNNNSNSNNSQRPRLDHKSRSTTSITKSSVIHISSSACSTHKKNKNKKDQEDNCSIHSSISSSSILSLSTSLSNNHQHKITTASSSSNKQLESSLSSLTSSIMTQQNDCILTQLNEKEDEPSSYHHYHPINKNEQLSAMDALVMASQLPTIKKIQFVDEAFDIPPPTLTDRFSFTHPLLNEAIARRYRLASEWNLLYSLDQHGASLTTLYDHCADTGPCILILKDDEEQIFGAFLNEHIHPDTSYYGTGECFLWKMTSNDKQQLNEKNHHPIPKIKTFSFTGRNEYMIYSTYDFLSFGGGLGKFGLWLNKDLEKCHSEPCDTFDNECLSLNHHFNCIGLEIWSFRF